MGGRALRLTGATEMPVCATCGNSLLPTDRQPAIRSGEAAYHLRCAPSELLDSAAEEYHAILRKGVRYFLEKYAPAADAEADPANRFLALGRGIEEERERRPKKPSGPPSPSPRA